MSAIEKHDQVAEAGTNAIIAVLEAGEVFYRKS